MSDELIFAGFGGTLAAIGVGLIWSHVKARRAHQQDTRLSDLDRRFFESQYSRRMQTSGLTVALGGLIAVGSRIELLGKSPWIATIYIASLLLLAVWLMLLGIGDAVASRIHAQRRQRESGRTHSNLADALAEVRATYGLSDDNRPE